MVLGRPKNPGVQGISSDGEKFSPSRDVVHAWKLVILDAIRAFDDKLWPELMQTVYKIAAAPELLEALVAARRELYDLAGEQVGSGRYSNLDAAVTKATTDEQKAEVWKEICEAHTSAWQVLHFATRDPNESFWDLLENVGWNKRQEYAKYAVAAMYGLSMLGFFWDGIRWVSNAGENPPKTLSPTLARATQLMRWNTEGKIEQEAAAEELRRMIRRARMSGLSYDEIARCVSDVKLEPSAEPGG